MASKQKSIEPPQVAGCYFGRLGDILHEVLPFLQLPWLLQLDTAMTNHIDRQEFWLPTLRGLQNAQDVLSWIEVDRTKCSPSRQIALEAGSRCAGL